MEFTTIDFCKICGILFFIMMAWYFAFVVFKTNKDFLVSIVQKDENPTSLDDLKSIFGSTTLKEGFSGKSGLNSLSDTEEKIKKQLNQLIAKYNLNDDGKQDIRKKITSILEKRTKILLLSGVDSMMNTDDPSGPALFKHIHEGSKYLLNLWKKQVDKLDSSSSVW